MSDETKRTPAYVSYKTFKTSIRELEHVPNTIDYSVYQSMNGSTRTFLFGAFKFFGLLQDGGKPTKRFQDMASGDESAWKKNVGELLQSHYKDQLTALQSGTVSSLKASFGDIGASVVGPACRFLIAAANDCDLTVSPSISKGSIGSAPPRKRRKENKNEDDNGGNADTDQLGGGNGTIAFPIPIHGKDSGKIVIPKDMDEDDIPMFTAMVAAVTAYAKQNTSRAT